MAKRKKSASKPGRERVLEYKGWSAGDRCYALMSGENKPSLCDVVEFHPNDHITPAVTVLETATGKTRVAAMRAIAETAKEAKEKGLKWRKWYAGWKKKQEAILREERRLAREAAEKEKAAATETETSVTESKETLDKEGEE
jgi:hypothetical protein